MSAPCLLVDLGIREYGVALHMQTRLVEARHAERMPDMLVFVEHPPTVTLGRSAQRENLLVGEAGLTTAGIAVHETNRGGDVTYHGPGQLVGYPILRLSGTRKNIHRYLRSLEQVLLEALDELGVAAQRLPGLTGVWVSEKDGRPPAKIAALGIALRHWVTFHGFALNIAPDLDHFALIRPCGLADYGVTSLQKLLGFVPVQSEVRDAVARAFCRVFEYTPRWVSPAVLLAEIETATIER